MVTASGMQPSRRTLQNYVLYGTNLCNGVCKLDRGCDLCVPTDAQVPACGVGVSTLKAMQGRASPGRRRA